MELLLSALQQLPEYRALVARLEAGSVAALSGVGQLPRSHMLAALARDLHRPALILCADDQAAQRTQLELAAFLPQAPALLPGREFTFCDASVVSRGWEHRRLTALWQLRRGELPVLVASLEALSLRTMPPAILDAAAIPLRPGMTLELDSLAARLTAAGYARTSLVEGPGQFSIRGGIVDVYAPNCDGPLRAEFWGDELDTMGFFDPLTQRRTENAEEAVLLPVAEALPHLHPQGVPGLVQDLTKLLEKQKRRKAPHAALLSTLEADREKLENGLPFPAADRYLSLIYPDFATAADYLPPDGLVLFCDHGSLSRADKARQENFGLELDACLQAGELAGPLCDFTADLDRLCRSFQGHPAAYLDSFLASAYPEALPPQELLSLTAKQLPGYGGSLDTAVSDLTYYQKNGYATLVLCGSSRRGEILLELLRERGLTASLAIPAQALPHAGEILLTDGSLPAGLEYPSIKLAVLTEGQISAAPLRKAKPGRKKATNRQKLNSFTDLSPGDLVVHETHGIGRYVAMEQIKVGGVVKE